MTIEISNDATQAAIVSIQRYFAENMDEEIGNLAAGALLGFSSRKSARSYTTKPWPMLMHGCKHGSWNSMSRCTKTSFSIGRRKGGRASALDELKTLGSLGLTLPTPAYPIGAILFGLVGFAA